MYNIGASIRQDDVRLNRSARESSIKCLEQS